MNDATEFESSFAGAIGFFQNLRQKLGVLEAATDAQHDRLYAIAASVTALQQDRQTDRQALTGLASDLHAQTAQLAELQTESRLLDTQLTTVETLVASFQQDQQQLRQTLTTLTSDWSVQNADLRQEFKSALQQQAAPAAQVAALEQQLADQTRELHSLLASAQALGQDAHAVRENVAALESRLEQQHGQFEHLETTVHAGQDQFEQFNAIAETQYAHLHQLETTLETLGQNTQAISEALAGLKTAFEQHDQTLDTLNQATATHETTRQQLQHQQTQLTESSVTTRQDVQALQQDLARLQGELETQRHILTDANQAQQALQKQQDRLKHLETLMGKVSADTNSTRQILNVLQTDLTTQSDTLRELDQTWRESLSAYQERLSHLETTVAAGPTQQPLALTAVANPPALTPEPLLATVLDEAETVATTLLGPPTIEHERLDELSATVVAAQQERQELRQELSTVQTALANQGENLAELWRTLQEQAQIQQVHLGQLEATLTDLRQTSTPDVAADFTPLHTALATQSEALAELRQTTQQQLTVLTTTLEHQQQEFQGAADVVGNLQHETLHLQRKVSRLDSAVEQQHHRLEAGDQHAQQSQQDLSTLQQAVTGLEARLVSQAQAFSGNFEQFRGLSAEVQHLQQQLTTLEPLPQQLGALEAGLAIQKQDVIHLKNTIQQIQIDSQQLSEVMQQSDLHPQVAELETKLDEHAEQLANLTAVIETIRTDTKNTQEKVVIMATNVAKRIFEFQNQLMTTETTQTERLQEAEQKLIQLQAALETLETQQKNRRWFSMPAMFTTIMLTVGAAFLGILAKVILTIG
ncbi:MAG: hypothetical protein U1F42_09340 [Candidatus Competibacteraceae bacterium]